MTIARDTTARSAGAMDAGDAIMRRHLAAAFARPGELPQAEARIIVRGTTARSAGAMDAGDAIMRRHLAAASARPGEPPQTEARTTVRGTTAHSAGAKRQREDAGSRPAPSMTIGELRAAARGKSVRIDAGTAGDAFAAFVADGLSPGQRRTRAAAVSMAAEWAAAYESPFADSLQALLRREEAAWVLPFELAQLATAADFMAFCVFAVGLAASWRAADTIIGSWAALLLASGAANFADNGAVRQFRKRLTGPTPSRPLELPFEMPRPYQLLAGLTAATPLRDRAFMLLRAASGIRAGDARSISARSLEPRQGEGGMAVVAFLYRPKGRMEPRPNYVEHLTGCAPDRVLQWMCPACALLELRDHAGPHQHDSLWVALSDTARPVQAATLNAALRRIMTAAGIPGHYRAHAVRQFWRAECRRSGVDDEAINWRADWGRGSTQALHYAGPRLDRNLADIALLPGRALLRPPPELVQGSPGDNALQPGDKGKEKVHRH